MGGAEEYREGVMRPCDLLVSWCLGVSHWSEPENCSRPASTARHKDTMTAYGHDPVSKISPDVLGLVDHTHPAAQLLEDAVVGDRPRDHLYPSLLLDRIRGCKRRYKLPVAKDTGAG